MRLDEIAELVEGQLEGDPSLEIHDVAPLDGGRAGTITFLADAAQAEKLATTGATAAIVGPDAVAGSLPVIRVSQPYLAFVRVVEQFHPEERVRPGRHPSAIVAVSAQIGPDASIGPHVVIGERVVLGAGAVLHAGVCLYHDVVAGDFLTAHANAVVRERTRIGNRVVLHAGAVIGSEGFGYLPTPSGPRRIPQVGHVVLEDDVEIGANTTVDRAALAETRIGRGSKIDNLVMVGHGCQIGPGCLLAGQVGLAGGTRLGAGVMLGGQVGSAGHLTVGDGAMVAAKSGIHDDLPGGAAYGGIPAVDIGVWRRSVVAAKHASDVLRRLRRLERVDRRSDRDESQ